MSNKFSMWYTSLPPSENKIRIIRVIRGRPGGMAYTREASDYKKDFKTFVRTNYPTEVVDFAKPHDEKSIYLVSIDLFFTKEQLINKGWPNTKTYYKKMDVGNRRKLLEDCLSEVIGIDDMYTFDLRMTKNLATSEDPGVRISIERIQDPERYGL